MTAAPAPPWRTALVGLVGLLVGLVVAVPGGGLLRGVVVQASWDVGGAVAAVRAQGGVVESVVGLVDAVVADVPAGRVGALEADPRVGSVTEDVGLRVQSVEYGGVDASPVSGVVRSGVGAAAGLSGRGVGVAILDTGVADHGDLAGRVVGWADVTAEADGVDRFGHGTFMAGVVAGDGAASGGRFAGVAPGVNLVSVKVAGADGATSLGQVLRGLDLVASSAGVFDTRVVLVALAGPDLPGNDPLQRAVQRLWADGVVVVAAAGNGGDATAPGTDPYVLTVGALDDAGTVDRGDDGVAAWSGRSTEAAKPDVIAPGVSVVAARAPGSTIAAANPQAHIGDDYLRGSGTSMAAAVTAGAAALLLEADPTLTPDQVKGRLAATATPVVDTDPVAAGHGTIDVAAAAVSDAPAANTDLPAPRPSPPAGQTDPDLEPAASSWAASSWAASSWAASSWAASSWAASSWAASSWAASSWAASSWAASSWAVSTWS